MVATYIREKEGGEKEKKAIHKKRQRKNEGLEEDKNKEL